MSAPVNVFVCVCVSYAFALTRALRRFPRQLGVLLIARFIWKEKKKEIYINQLVTILIYLSFVFFVRRIGSTILPPHSCHWIAQRRYCIAFTMFRTRQLKCTLVFNESYFKLATKYYYFVVARCMLLSETSVILRNDTHTHTLRMNLKYTLNDAHSNCHTNDNSKLYVYCLIKIKMIVNTVR